jgi:MFS family permease
MTNPTTSTWTPLRTPAFRVLWFAQLGGMLGTWMQTVGAQWLLVDAPGAATLVSLVQVAALLPVLLLAFPAGALADILDRRRMLIAVQAFQLGVAGALTALTATDRMTPPLLLTFTFLLGCGAALAIPAFGVLLQELVPREQVRAAASMGGIAMNIARAVGPALAGLVIAWTGPEAVFGINAVSFVVVMVALVGVRTPRAVRDGPPERFAAAIRAGGRYVRHSPVVRRLLLRAALFVLPGAALWALLPLVASDLLGLGAPGYGVMLGALGVGAVLAADLVPRYGSHLSANRVLLASGAAFGLALLACALVRSTAVVLVTLVLAGMAWLSVLVGVSGTLQVFLPAWVRARGLAVFTIVFAGGQAGGAFLWGVLAQWWGLVPTFVMAAVVMAAGTATVVVWPLRDVSGWNRDPQVYWPEPDLHTEPDPDAGPVLVTITFTVADEQVADFVDAMATLRRVKLRTGATSSVLYHDGVDPNRFVDVSVYPTWAEHLRQHRGRLTGTDREAEERALALADGPGEVAHLFPAHADRPARTD